MQMSLLLQQVAQEQQYQNFILAKPKLLKIVALTGR